MFFSKRSKCYVDSKKAIKLRQKVFDFLDNCIRIGCRNFSVLGRENLLLVINMLTNSPGF